MELYSKIMEPFSIPWPRLSILPVGTLLMINSLKCLCAQGATISQQHYNPVKKKFLHITLKVSKNYTAYKRW